MSSDNRAENYSALIKVARARYRLACDEMDRLTAGNPGTNWRWSIPANPDRDSDLILSASAEDVPRLADAVEALTAENDMLRASFQEAEQIHEGVVRRLAAERDALQAQLDSMTVEAGVKYHPSAGVVPYPGEKQARAVSAGFAGRRIMKRLVGPWVEVKGEEA
jgi:hypothetical protein